MFDEEQFNTWRSENQGFDCGGAGIFSPEAAPFRGFSANRMEAALQYIGKGLNIFSCEPHAKEPSTPHGFKDATTDIRYFDHPRLQGLASVILQDGTDVLVAENNNW